MKKIIAFLTLFGALASECFAQISLDYFLDAAKKNSLLINDIKTDKKIALLNFKLSKAIFQTPSVDIDANVYLAPIVSLDGESNNLELVAQNASNYFGYDLALSDGGQYRALLSLRYPLFSNPAIEAYKNLFEIKTSTENNDVRLTEREIERAVSKQYALCLNSKKLSEIAKNLFEKLKERLEIVQSLVKQGLYKQKDAALLRLEVKNYEIDYRKSRSRFESDLYDLYDLCGLDGGLDENLKETSPKLGAPISESKFLLSYKLDSLEFEAQRKLFELKYLPKVNLFFDAGLNAVYLPAFNRLGFGLGIGFQWNIYDGFQSDLERQKTALKTRALDFAKSKLETKLALKKKKLLRLIRSVEERISDLDSQLKNYDDLLALYNEELKAAQISILDYKNLIKDIAETRRQKAILKTRKDVLIYEYNYWNY